MRQGIITRYLGPTNTQGSRIKAIARKADAWGPAMQTTVNRLCELGIEENHCRAAETLAWKLGWSGVWVGGGHMSDCGYQFVCLPFNVTPETLAGHTEGPHPLGKEGADWFYVPRREEARQ